MLGILERIFPSEHAFNSYFVIHNFVRGPHTKFTVFFFGYFCCFCIHFTQINIEIFKNKCKASLLKVVFIWNRNWILMLERPLSHYWTSPLMFMWMQLRNVQQWNKKSLEIVILAGFIPDNSGYNNLEAQNLDQSIRSRSNLTLTIFLTRDVQHEGHSHWAWKLAKLGWKLPSNCTKFHPKLCTKNRKSECDFSKFAQDFARCFVMRVQAAVFYSRDFRIRSSCSAWQLNVRVVVSEFCMYTVQLYVHVLYCISASALCQ